MVVFGHVGKRRPTDEELRHDAALVLAARIGAGRPPSEAPRRPRPEWARREPRASWYHPPAPAAPDPVAAADPLVLRTVHLPLRSAGATS